MSGNVGDVGSNSGVLLPVIIGLALGVAFIVSIAVFTTTSTAFPYRPPIEDEFRSIEQIPEVRLFLDKYGDHDFNNGFSRFQNGTIKFSYITWAQVDKDGDGYKETFRRLELTLFYDESGGMPIYKSYDPDRLKQIQVRCREQIAISLDEDQSFTDIMRPAYDGQVRDILENARCLF